ncbi:MAG TPA: hypothetical protein PKA19_16265 [Bacillota bacterium]|nr:hypothetical protein [Bacillota bacterium]
MDISEIAKNEWIGTDSVQQAPRRFQTGSLTLDYISGRIANISVGGKRVIDEVYFALRDCNWGTIPYRIENFAAEEAAGEFDISFTALHEKDEIRFMWEGHITGRGQSVAFSFDGLADSDFMRNRIGFCVLHPAACGGVECEVEHLESPAERGVFPEEIAPNQPFIDIKSIAHFPFEGMAVKVAFEGDVFEMEDQRNWTDASFKTYCTPLRLPFPAPVKKGERFHQAVIITVEADAEQTAGVSSSHEETVSLSKGEVIHGSTFSLGSCVSGPLTDLQMERVKALELSHLRYEYRFDGSSAPAENIAAQARELGVKLYIAAFFSGSFKSELSELAEFLDSHQSDILGIAVFEQDVKVISEEKLSAARQALSRYSIPVGSGTDAFFTQINRERLPASLMDFVNYSNNPQVHAFDNMSIMTTTEGQTANLLSCAKLYPGLPVWVSPITLKMRWNPDTTGKIILKKREMHWDVEPRQISLFAASWFLRSLAACLKDGAAVVTYFELTGCKGIMEDTNPRRDYRFPSAPDMLYPLYYAFYALRGLKDFDITAVITEHVTALILKNSGETRLILSNTKEEEIAISLSDATDSAKGIIIDEDNVAALARKSLVSDRDLYGNTYSLKAGIRLKSYAIFIAKI